MRYMDIYTSPQNLQAKPKYDAEEINLAVVADRQVKMDGAINVLSSAVQLSPDIIRQQVGQTVAQNL